MNLHFCVFTDPAVCQLSVQPNGTIFHRSLGDNIVFTCSLDLPAGSVIINIQWLDPNHVEILDKSPGRDKYDAISFSHSKLYSTEMGESRILPVRIASAVYHPTCYMLWCSICLSVCLSVCQILGLKACLWNV